MKSRINEQGSILHFVIIALVAIVLLGTLGWIFWQNFVDKAPANNSIPSTMKDDDKKSVGVYDGWKSYTFSDTGTKFHYPSNWEVSYFSPSEESGRITSSLLLILDNEKVLASNVIDFLWPSIEIYDPNQPEPRLGSDWDVIYSEQLPNSMHLVCTYHQGQELPGGPVLQHLVFDLIGEGFNAKNVAGSSKLMIVDGKSLIISGGSVGYQDGSLTRDVAKKLCESPKAGEYTTQVIRWLKSIEL